MKTNLTMLFAALLLGSAAFAGGPIVVVEEEEVIVEEQPSSSTGILPLLLIPVALCLVLCGRDDPELMPR